MRRAFAFVLVLGLAPGVTGGLSDTAFGAHCAHPCCQGQNFCHRGSGAGHDHETDPAAGSHHGAHEAPAPFAVTAIEPPSQSCLETCGVLPDVRPRTGSATRSHHIETIQQVHPAPRAILLVAETRALEDPASPRGPPPREHLADTI